MTLANAPTVGLVGFGRIGGAVARHVLAAGYRMLGWARRPEALVDFVAQGGIAVDSLAGLAAADLVISVVFDDAATRAVAFGPHGFLRSMRPGTTHVAMETVSPDLARELADAHAGLGQHFLSAPVFGRPEVAARGELAIMCSGPEEVFREVAPVLDTAGKARWIGPEPEQAMLLKLAGNHAILVMGEMLAEVLGLLEAGGVAAPDVADALFSRLMPDILAGYARRLADQPGSPRPADSAIGRKDNALLLAAGRRSGRDLPLARFLRAERMPPEPG